MIVYVWKNRTRARSSIQYKTAQTSVGSHFCIQCCSSSDRYVVCRLARESMWSVQEIVKTPKREHRARPYRIPLGSLQTSTQTSSQNSLWSSFYSPCSPLAMSPTAVSPGGFASPGTSFKMSPQPTMTQHEAWPHQYPWMPSWPYYGPCPAPSMPAPAQSSLLDSRFTNSRALKSWISCAHRLYHNKQKTTRRGLRVCSRTGCCAETPPRTQPLKNFQLTFCKQIMKRVLLTEL